MNEISAPVSPIQKANFDAGGKDYAGGQQRSSASRKTSRSSESGG